MAKAPKDFFHKDTTRYDGNMTAALDQLLDMLAGKPNKLSLVRTLIESNPVIQAPNYSARYKGELNALLNKKAPIAEQPATLQK